MTIMLSLKDVRKMLIEINKVCTHCLGYIVLTENGYDIQDGHGAISCSKKIYPDLNPSQKDEEKYKNFSLRFDFDNYDSEEEMISCLSQLILQEYDLYLKENLDLEEEDDPKAYHENIQWAQGILNKYIKLNS